MPYKRGPKVGDAYPVTGRLKVSREMDDLARRRTVSLLDHHGVETRPLSILLREAWLIGVKDGAAACGKDVG
jgi:hypothetical protein